MAQDELTTIEAPLVALGTPVVYVGGKGLPKLALVTGTPETVVEGHSLPVLEPGQLHLAVWETGNFVQKLNVPFEQEGIEARFWRMP